MPALIFDCDGVLADTEQDGHLPAFNATFREFDLPVTWTVEDYAQKVKIGGGKERLASLLTPRFIAEAGLPRDPEEQRSLVAEWHRYKTTVYTDMVGRGVMPARPGIQRLVNEAVEAGWTMAVASTSARPSVRAVLTHAVGETLAAKFAIFAGDDVPAKKPAPDIYLLARQELDVATDDVVVVEDSENGFRAALAAGLRTVVTVSSFTKHEDFTGASLVVTCLGDPDGPDARMLSNPLDLDHGDVITLDHFRAVLDHPIPAVGEPQRT